MVRMPTQKEIDEKFTKREDGKQVITLSQEEILRNLPLPTKGTSTKKMRQRKKVKRQNKKKGRKK